MVNLKIWQITLVNIRISFSPEKYKKVIKKSLIDTFNINTFHSTFLLHIFPLLFGFYQMIWSRYKYNSFEFFLEKNLPGMILLKEEISWETFEKIKSKNLVPKEIKKFNIYNNCILVELEKNDQLISVGNYSNKQSVVKNNQYSRNSTFLLVKDNIQKNFRNNKRQVLLIPEISKNIFNGTDTTQFFSNCSAVDLRSKPKILDNISLKNMYYYLDELPLKIEGIRPAFNFLFFEKQKIFQGEITNLFYKKLFISPEWFRKNDHELKKFEEYKVSSTNLSDVSVKEILDLIVDFKLIKKNEDISPRFFSGYQYPEVNSKKVFSIIFQEFFQNKKFIKRFKIILPSHIIPFVEDLTSIPSVLLNNKFISDRKDNFFSFHLDLDKEEKQLAEKLVLESLTAKDLMKNKELDDSDPNDWFLLLDSLSSTDSIFSIEEQKLFTLSKSKKVKNRNCLENDNLLNLFSFLKIQNLEKEKISFDILSSTQSFTLNSFKNTYFFGNNYKKTPSLTTNLIKKIRKNNIFQFDEIEYFECWEPLSINSWMIVSQFSLGFFILKILQDLYKDYGKELLYYVLQFAASLGIDVKEIKEQFLADDADKGYRFIKKVSKGFKDIAGIDGILPQLSELVWFLRNSGRSKKFRKSIPKGILLVGPPGTGKTLIVQAIAGEASVPVLVESGSLLTDPEQRGKGIQRLKKLFEDARQLSPCIIFIDEIDTLGEKRQQIIQPAMGDDEIIESIYDLKKSKEEEEFIPKPLNFNDEIDENQNLEFDIFHSNQENKKNLKLGQIQQKNETKKTRLSLLMQFLVEMDGLNKLEGVIVIGATNRPNVLDPALIRPGRFDQILNLELPGKNKRIEILKLYSEKLTTENNISWDYLANRTIGFSAADLAAVMNESAIQAILENTVHTVETIERGIDLITSYSSVPSLKDKVSHGQKNVLNHDRFYVSRLAYYKAGQAILHSLIPEHLPAIVFHLWPRQKNTRHKNIQQNSNTQLKNRYQLESQIIGLYSGKAAELLLLYGSKDFKALKYWESNIGIEDLISATFISHSMIDKWFFYSKTNLNRKNHQLFKDRNLNEYKQPEKIEMMKLLDLELEEELTVEQLSKVSRFDQSQQLGYGPWWQIQTANQISDIESFYAEWYRIYLPDPEESILNIEWVPPDEYYHANDSLKTISNKSNLKLNEIYKIERDYIYQGLILNSFNKAFSILDEYREFLDFFADYLTRYTILREDQIQFILENEIQDQQNKFLKKQDSTHFIKIVDTQWGNQSRRKISRFINFNRLK